MEHMISSMRRIGLAVLAVLTLAACDRPDGETEPPDAAPPPISTGQVTPVTFEAAIITFITSTDSVQMTAEVAERADQRAYGLMDRDELDPDAGMIFLYDQIQNQDTGFWMYRTRIPLDIAYFDGAGRIVAIQQMMPCTSLDPARCTGYAAGVPFFGAVEANRAYFSRNGIRTGDRVVLPGRVGG
jgi:uncharacterized membrane protein (UPF0127 family)